MAPNSIITQSFGERPPGARARSSRSALQPNAEGLSNVPDSYVQRMTRRCSMPWLCLRPPEQPKPGERVLLATLLAQDGELPAGHALPARFRGVIATRDSGALEDWPTAAQASDLPTFTSLANGIEADPAAVDAAQAEYFSNRV